jgi:hypothetical protein
MTQHSHPKMAEIRAKKGKKTGMASTAIGGQRKDDPEKEGQAGKAKRGRRHTVTRR